MINKSNIGEVTIEEKGFKLTIKQKAEPVQNVFASAPPQQVTMPQSQPALPTSGSLSPATTTDKGKTAEAANENYITIKSPMIGTFYRSQGPGKPAFVEIGDDITPGKVVCIIEAMKLFNEIESEVKGRIIKVLIEDASPVEYDQPLFLVEPA